MGVGAWNTPIENWTIGLTDDKKIKNLRIGLTGNTLIKVIIPLNSFSLQSKKRL